MGLYRSIEVIWGGGGPEPSGSSVIRSVSTWVPSLPNGLVGALSGKSKRNCSMVVAAIHSAWAFRSTQYSVSWVS